MSPPKTGSDEKPLPDTTKAFASFSVGCADEAGYCCFDGTDDVNAEGVCVEVATPDEDPGSAKLNPSIFVEGLMPLLETCEVNGVEDPLLLPPIQSVEMFMVFEVGSLGPPTLTVPGNPWPTPCAGSKAAAFGAGGGLAALMP